MNWMSDYIRYKQLNWYGHVQRMNEGRLPLKILEWCPSERRRRRKGSPRNFWMPSVAVLSASLNILSLSVVKIPFAIKLVGHHDDEYVLTPHMKNRLFSWGSKQFFLFAKYQVLNLEQIELTVLK